VPPVCIRCRAETEEDREGDLALRLDGRPMLEALRAAPRESLSDEQRAFLDRLAAGMCPVCGRAL
jgi:hypothetical protein